MKRPLAVAGFTVFFTLMLLAELASWAVFVILGGALAVVLALAIYQRAGKPPRPSDTPPREGNIRPYKASSQLTCTAAALAVAAACLLSWAGQSALDAAAESYTDKTLPVTARVQEISAPRYGRYYAVCKALSVGGLEASFRFRLSMRSPVPCEEGDILSGDLTFFEYQNPARRVCLGAYVPIQTELSAEKAPSGIGGWVYALRNRLLRSMDEYLPNEYGALARGLMLGEISGLSQGTNADFRTLGLSHIIAVSGQHLSIWCIAVLAPFFALLRTKKRTRALLISAFALLFTALTGFTDSIVRSALMLVLTQAGTLINRRADALNSLGFAVLLICAVSPGAAQGLGLQLSFLATLGILLAQQPGGGKREAGKKRAAGIRPRTAPLNKAAAFIRETAKCTLFATLFTLPLTLRVSGRLGLLAVPANIVFALPAGAAMVLSGLCALFSLVPGLSLLSAPLAFICGLCCKFMIRAARLMARVPFASLPARGSGMELWLCGTLLICALAVLLIYLRGGREKQLQRRILPLAALLCAALLLSAQAADWSALRAGTRFTLIQTGAVCVAVTRGSRTLILGADGDAFNAAGAIMDTLDKNGSREVEVILSSAGKAETDNLSAVLGEIPATRVYSPEAGAGYLLPPGTPLTALASGQEIDWADGVKIKYYNDGTARAALVQADGAGVLVLFAAEWSFLPDGFLGAEVLICPGALPEIPPGMKLAMVANGTEHAARLAKMGLRAVSYGQLTVDNGQLTIT